MKYINKKAFLCQSLNWKDQKLNLINVKSIARNSSIINKSS